MPFKIRNWKLACLALLFFCLFISLGNWQLTRAKQKTLLLHSFAKRTEHPPLTAKDLNKSSDQRFYRITLTGHFDNAHTLLLDNKIFHGKVGYEIYTPFYAKDMTNPILVDRGFIQMVGSRRDLPRIHPVEGTVTISGMLNLPPTYVALGQIKESPELRWPLRLEFINLTEIDHILRYTDNLYPYIVNIEPKNPAAYDMEWQVVTMGPERHQGYAVQWFALALTLLILFTVLNRDPKKTTKGL